MPLKLQTEGLGCVLFVGQPCNSVGGSILNPFKCTLVSKPAVTLDYITCHFIRLSFQHSKGLAYFILWVGWVSSSLLGLSSFSLVVIDPNGRRAPLAVLIQSQYSIFNPNHQLCKWFCWNLASKFSSSQMSIGHS